MAAQRRDLLPQAQLPKLRVGIVGRDRVADELADRVIASRRPAVLLSKRETISASASLIRR